MPPKELEIRKFEGSDYPEIVRLENKVFLEVETSVESLRFRDETRPEKCKHQRFVAELDDELMGHGFYSQWEGSYQPGKFSIHIEIHPNYQGEGHGKKFYQYLLKELEKHEPKKLVCYTREDKERAIRFIEDRGFEESMRMWTLELDVDDFEPEEYYELRKKLMEKGIELTTLAEMGIDEDTSRKLHEVYEEAMHDVPMSDEYTGTDHDRFIEFFEHPDFFPEAYIIAVKDDEIVGLSSHWKKEEQDVLYTQLTGVREEYRGKGLATAMKVKAIEIASEKGIPKIRTDNETGNEAMLHINQKFGFKKKPAWISYEKVLKR